MIGSKAAKGKKCNDFPLDLYVIIIIVTVFLIKLKYHIN